MKQIELVATDEVQGFRVDKAISVLYGDLSRSAVQNLLEEQKILLNGKTAKKIRKEIKSNRRTRF